MFILDLEEESTFASFALFYIWYIIKVYWKNSALKYLCYEVIVVHFCTHQTTMIDSFRVIGRD